MPAFSGPALTHGFQVAFYALIGVALVGAAIAAVFVESKPKAAPERGAGRSRDRARGSSMIVASTHAQVRVDESTLPRGHGCE